MALGADARKAHAKWGIALASASWMARRPLIGRFVSRLPTGQRLAPQRLHPRSGAGTPVHIDAALIEAERQVRDLLTEANKVPSDTDVAKQVWVAIDRMAATPAKTLARSW